MSFDESRHLSLESGEEDLGAAGLLRGAYSAGPVSPTCSTALLSKAKAGYALR